MQIVGFCIAVIFFALMRQAHAWELDLPIPSMITAVESNLRMPLPFLLLAAVPILISLLLSLLTSQLFPPVASFITVSIICYLFANGCIIIVILISQLVFYVAAVVHVFIKTRWESSLSNAYYFRVEWCDEVFLQFGIADTYGKEKRRGKKARKRRKDNCMHLSILFFTTCFSLKSSFGTLKNP